MASAPETKIGSRLNPAEHYNATRDNTGGPGAEKPGITEEYFLAPREHPLCENVNAFGLWQNPVHNRKIGVNVP
jgi:hypothetical protein